MSLTELSSFCCSHCFNDKDYALMSLCSWVNVVVGRMTAIDRVAKHVVVSQEDIVHYDHLILCTGQQYQVRLRRQGRAGSCPWWTCLPNPRTLLQDSCRCAFTNTLSKPCARGQSCVHIALPGTQSRKKKSLFKDKNGSELEKYS